MVEGLTCPYCGEPAEPDVSELGPEDEEFIEDCAVCCRPWTVRVHRSADDEDEPLRVELLRDDA